MSYCLTLPKLLTKSPLQDYSIRWTSTSKKWIESFSHQRSQHVSLHVHRVRSDTAEVLSGVSPREQLSVCSRSYTLSMTFVLSQYEPRRQNIWRQQSPIQGDQQWPWQSPPTETSLCTPKVGRNLADELQPNWICGYENRNQEEIGASNTVPASRPLDAVDVNKYRGGGEALSKLTWTKHIQTTVAKTNRIVGSLRKNLKDCKLQWKIQRPS